MIVLYSAGDQFQSDEHDMKDFKFVRHLTKEKVRLDRSFLGENKEYDRCIYCYSNWQRFL